MVLNHSPATRFDLELELLTIKPFGIEDCLALRTKIQQIFGTIYKLQSNESDPITRLKAMISVHNMLDLIDRSKPNGHSVTLIKSWKAYSAYLPTQIFMEYLDEILHQSSEESDRLCDLYIKIVVQHLSAAHRMHIQTVWTDSADMTKGNVPGNLIQNLGNSESAPVQRSRSRFKNGSDNVNAYAGRVRSNDQKRSVSAADRFWSRGSQSLLVRVL